MRDLEGFITAMGWSGVRAIGHSAGATAIGSLACERPDLIARAVLLEPVIFESAIAPELNWRNPFIERTLKRRRVFDSVEAMFSNFENKPPYNTWRKEILHDYCEFGTRATQRRQARTQMRARGRGEILRDLARLRRARADSPLRRCRCWWCSGSAAIRWARHCRGRSRSRIRNGRVIDVADTGHFMPMEKPEYAAI